MRVAFRCDASTLIGTGHVARCLSLADALARGGADVSFVSRELPGNLCELITARGHVVHRLPAPHFSCDAGNGLAHAHWLGVDWQRDAQEALAALGPAVAGDWLVVDHYALDARWEREAGAGRKRALIDDLADREHCGALLLDQNLEASAERYRTRISADARLLLGPRYALLRPEFAPLRAQARSRDGSIHRVLLNFGGADTANHTLAALQAVAASRLRAVTVDVVLGPLHPDPDAVRRVAASLPDCSVTQAVPELGTHMAVADLAIGAGGGTVWERACLGLPAVLLPTAANQRAQVAAFVDCGAGLSLAHEPGWPAALSALLDVLATQPAWLRQLSVNSARLVDGRGAERVAREILSSGIRLRLAEARDERDLWLWRNHEDTRRFALDPSLIDWDTHCRWFEQVLNRADRSLLIAESEAGAVGVLRLDLEDTTAEISIYLVPGRAGQGLGSALLRAAERWVRAQLPAVRGIEAVVLERNAASLAAFRAAGYEAHSGRLRRALIGDDADHHPHPPRT